MKKYRILVVLMSLVCAVNAQPGHQSMRFRNYWECVQYQCANPERIPVNLVGRMDAGSVFSQKLDSVIGSDNYDYTHWKNVYTYGSDEEQPYNDRNRTEIHYVWDRQAWQPELKTELSVENSDEKAIFYHWNGESWDAFSQVVYDYEVSDGGNRLSTVLTESFADTAWMGSSLIGYEYDDQSRLIRVMNYNHLNDAGEWEADSKVEYAYQEDGKLARMLYASIRNGNWRENQKDTLAYDENNRCVSLTTQRKGGFGPGASNWRDASKYEFAYAEDGSLESELFYSAGWFGTEMTLESKTQYQFDTQGNMVRKTVSIYNGTDWIVRDLYENRFENTQEASAFLGMAPLWESTVTSGLGNVLNPDVPLYSQWLSCSIVSTMLDTQFDLYYSGFAAVEEHAPALLRVFSSEGKLVVEQDVEAEVTVYDLLGRVVATQSQAVRCEFVLKPGLYLVGNGKHTVKALLR